MNIVVLGAGGYIGSVLVHQLLDASHNIFAIDRYFFGKHTLNQHKNLHIIVEDTRYMDGHIFKDMDVVIDLAGISNDPACDLNEVISRSINLGGLINCADSAKKHGVSQYIYSSSCSVYGHSNNEWVDENSIPHPVSLYAQLKLECENHLNQLHDQNSFNVTILRNSTVYGVSPRMRFDLIINLMTLHAYKNKQVHVLGGGSQWRPLIHINNLCQAFISVLTKQKESSGHTFNVGENSHNYRVIEIANIVKTVLPDTQILIAPDDNDKRSYRVNCDKIKNLLKYKTCWKPRDGIHDIIRGLMSGNIKEDITTNTVGYYKYLLEAKQRIDELLIDGILL